ncbi:UNVERIFIED_CONTAM: hypothetical protein K2H54_044130 [Gekko kuhli]
MSLGSLMDTCEMLSNKSLGISSQVVLTQSEPVLKPPGESHRLSCATSGFTLSSTWMYWVRQKPGKGLEWLVSYYKPGSGYEVYSPAIQGRFTASKSGSNFYLQMNSLKVEDTAVYYCTRDTVRGILAELRQKPFFSSMKFGEKVPEGGTRQPQANN